VSGLPHRKKAYCSEGRLRSSEAASISGLWARGGSFLIFGIALTAIPFVGYLEDGMDFTTLLIIIITVGSTHRLNAVINFIQTSPI
jgi:hypothetical protein